MFINTPIARSDKSIPFYAVVDGFIKKDFPLLDDLDIMFSFVEPSRFVGQTPVPVRSYKYPASVRDLFEHDFHVELSKDAWREATRDQRLIMVWQGLRALGVEIDEGMVPKLDAVGRIMTFLAKPDIEASFFSDQILKFGADASLRSLTKVLQMLVDKDQKKSGVANANKQQK